MKAAQLKNSILQLAVQGKLVEQDPNDEPASALLERIREEKKRLVKEGKIKKNKTESVIYRAPKEDDDTTDNLPYTEQSDGARFVERFADGTERDITDELPFEIPESWEWVRLESIGYFVRGSGIKRNETRAAGVPCVRYGEIYTTYNIVMTDAVSFVDEELADKSKSLRHGDLLLTLTGENKEEIGKTVAFMGDKRTVIGGDLATFTSFHQNPVYLSYLMNSPCTIKQKKLLGTGDIIVHISCDKLSSILVSLPPLPEQQRIVERIEELLPHIADYDVAEQKLTALNTVFPEKLKKSILQAAVQGKLVEQDPNDEPASALLERIRAEKATLVKAGKIKKTKHESVIFRRDNSHYEKLDGIEHCIDNEIPFEIPENWAWTRLNSLGQIIGGGTPKTEKVANWRDGTIPWLTPADMKNVNGKYVERGERDITEQGLSNSSTQLMPENTIVYSSRAPIGYIAITRNPICTNQGFKSLVPHNIAIVPYCYYCLIERTLEIQSRASGTTFKEISGSEFGKTLIPLPPLGEQARIVERVEVSLKVAKLL